MITSTRNPRIKWIRSLQSSSRSRRQEGLFVVEGVRLLEEALAAGWQARLALYTDDLGARGQAVLGDFIAQGAPAEQVAAHVLRAASDTETPQGLLAVLAWQALPLPEALDFVVIPDGVRDPGNLGAILRTAQAAGVQAVFLPPGSVDAFAPKVLRAGMGAHFRLPVHSSSWDEIEARLALLQVYLAAADADLPYTQADFCAPLALVIGGEAQGAGWRARALASQPVRIPMPGGAESLNAAVAAAVLIFEVARQRGEADR